MLNSAELTGQASSHVVSDACCRASVRLQPQVFAAYRAMREAAQQAGIELDIASGFRDFARQREIWNRKFSGDAPLYDSSGALLDPSSLSTGEKVEAIMTWSALPGASRHHWGTDFDVYDPRPFADQQRQLQLIPAEYEEGGPCYDLALWLYRHAADFGFFFPYRVYQGGVAAEPWHLSHRSSASEAQQQLTTALLIKAVRNNDVAGSDYLCERMHELKERYVDNICSDNTAAGDNGWLFG
ncbi:M15 family metallopeptidase [Pseudidiomarina insulisalsae]|uniref:D-alanyl-D-alanine carboxypeptidase n=1 Tax=Pseudidiomarina insulisalsae TaxID=575789 RepID=A0A432YMK5_9GAMM|nr:M15 family metallopeptidase [Pseudidiomarina insulisalsae]RUO62173.1 D-alanyl-D-alanine carboxypeptidase [Pseudidiomarina insulisalsae]